MSALSALTNSELRVVTRLLNTLRKDHNIQFGYRDPELGLKLLSTVIKLNDPVVSALWGALPEGFRNEPPSTDKAQHGGMAKAKGTDKRIYRGVALKSDGDDKEPSEIQAPKNSAHTTVNDESKPKGQGKYIVYRGTKQWVPD